MARSVRQLLISQTHQAIECIDRLDELLYRMNELHGGRQEAIPELTPLLLEAHEQLREAWRLLRSRL